MSGDLIQPAVNLGVAGFAILVMWWMYQAAAKERQRNDDRMDRKDEAFRQLNAQVRGEITAQLIAATSTIRDNIKIMEHVVAKLKIK